MSSILGLTSTCVDADGRAGALPLATDEEVVAGRFAVVVAVDGPARGAFRGAVVEDEAAVRLTGALGGIPGV